jgi:hypothetical protein
VVNTPHNPTGKVFSRAELDLIAELCQRHDTLSPEAARTRSTPPSSV